MSIKKYQYYDLEPLICITVLFMGWSILTSFFAIIWHIKDYIVLSTYDFVGSYSNYSSLFLVTSIIKIFLWFINAFFFFPILYFFNCNVKSLNAKNMQFLPLDVVYWHFTPIVRLWRPYQAMKEIWKTSVNPKEWETIKCIPLLHYLWFFGVLKIIFLNICIFFAYFQTYHLVNCKVANIIAILFHSDSIIYFILLLIFLRKVYVLQNNNFIGSNANKET